MFKRSNSFTSLLSPSTGIEALGERLKVIHPYAGINPKGLCFESTIETAEVLTTIGRNPQEVDFSSPKDPAAKAPQNHDRSFRYNDGLRAYEIWAWLKSGGVPGGGVFVVNMDAVMIDGLEAYHCWNYVKGPELVPSIYLIDSSLHIFKEVVHPSDFSEWMTEDFSDPMKLFNYADPDGMVNDNLEVYYWGQLVFPWVDELQRPVQEKSREAPF